MEAQEYFDNFFEEVFTELEDQVINTEYESANPQAAAVRTSLHCITLHFTRAADIND